MSTNNDCNSSKNNLENDTFLKNKIIKPQIDISLVHNDKNNNISSINITNDCLDNNSNIPKKFWIDKNFSYKNENLSLNNISAFNPFSQNSNEKMPIFKRVKNNYKQINKIMSPNPEKYSNAILFKNRITKHLRFKSEKNLSQINLENKNNYIQNDILNNNSKVLRYNKYNYLNNHFFTPSKRRITTNKYESTKNYSLNNIKNNYNHALSSAKKRKKTGLMLPRVNSAFLFPKMNSLNSLKYSSQLLDIEKEKEKEKEKLIINQNLKKLFYKIKKKIMPKKRVILSSYKLPAILNRNNGKNSNINPNSCIHRLEYGNSIVFVKTHLDGLEEEQKRKQKKGKTIRKYDINEGYVDLNVLNSGNNISFKTNLIEKDGLYFYEFNKYGRMETVEEKVHKVKKDKKEFKKLLERYHKNEVFKNIENQDFEVNIKRNYGAEPVINKNIYRDLFHMLFKK